VRCHGFAALDGRLEPRQRGVVAALLAQPDAECVRGGHAAAGGRPPDPGQRLLTVPGGLDMSSEGELRRGVATTGRLAQPALGLLRPAGPLQQLRQPHGRGSVSGADGLGQPSLELAGVVVLISRSRRRRKSVGHVYAELVAPSDGGRPRT
jgi:hypothetical protein